MGNFKVRGKDLKNITISTHRAKSLALDLLSKHYKHTEKHEQLNIIKTVVDEPTKFLNDPIFSQLAEELAPIEELEPIIETEMRETANPFNVFGRKLISSNAYQQMEWAMKLPIAEKGALMPDAHHGYGLPIGGVLATKNAVIPYGVGMDIGCRMSLTLYDVSEDYFKKHHFQFEQALKSSTFFGNATHTDLRQEHEVLDQSAFQETALLRQLHGKAVHQLGTSGSGNHFVEFGMVELFEDDEIQDLKSGKYLGLLAHSGSRGLGAAIASHYTNIAKERCYLPRHVANLAWLDLDSNDGQEYWLSMNLAGDYAKACHDTIHKNLSKALGLKALAKVENHHNFAWKERDENGQELIVHRKGATPAKLGEMGIIPGSMSAPGFIVKGLGGEGSLNSASHGAGRRLSRGAAKSSLTGSEMKKHLKQKQVKLIGGGVDESPLAYKPIEEVMRYQQDLVKAVGKFTPRLVRMNKN